MVRKADGPPDPRATDPRLLGISELEALHRRTGEWLAEAEAATGEDAPDDETLAAARDLLVRLTKERRDRQADERRDT
jgi:hypothetical protein